MANAHKRQRNNGSCDTGFQTEKDAGACSDKKLKNHIQGVKLSKICPIYISKIRIKPKNSFSFVNLP